MFQAELPSYNAVSLAGLVDSTLEPEMSYTEAPSYSSTDSTSDRSFEKVADEDEGEPDDQDSEEIDSRILLVKRKYILL